MLLRHSGAQVNVKYIIHWIWWSLTNDDDDGRTRARDASQLFNCPTICLSTRNRAKRSTSQCLSSGRRPNRIQRYISCINCNRLLTIYNTMCHCWVGRRKTYWTNVFNRCTITTSILEYVIIKSSKCNSKIPKQSWSRPCCWFTQATRTQCWWICMAAYVVVLWHCMAWHNKGAELSTVGISKSMAHRLRSIGVRVWTCASATTTSEKCALFFRVSWKECLYWVSPHRPNQYGSFSGALSQQTHQRRTQNCTPSAHIALIASYRIGSYASLALFTRYCTCRWSLI